MMAALTLQEEVILREKVKQYPVLFDKQLEGYKEKDAIHGMQWQKKYKSGGFYCSHTKIIRMGG